MSTPIEWLTARQTKAEVLTASDDWAGADEQDGPVLTLTGDEVVAIEGTPTELRAPAARIVAATEVATVPEAITQHRPT